MVEELQGDRDCDAEPVRFQIRKRTFGPHSAHAGVESTGQYWRAIWNVLEGHFEKLLLVHIKGLNGYKTDPRMQSGLPDEASGMREDIGERLS